MCLCRPLLTCILITNCYFVLYVWIYTKENKSIMGGWIKIANSCHWIRVVVPRGLLRETETPQRSLNFKICDHHHQRLLLLVLSTRMHSSASKFFTLLSPRLIERFIEIRRGIWLNGWWLWDPNRRFLSQVVDYPIYRARKSKVDYVIQMHWLVLKAIDTLGSISKDEMPSSNDGGNDYCPSLWAINFIIAAVDGGVRWSDMKGCRSSVHLDGKLRVI